MAENETLLDGVMTYEAETEGFRVKVQNYFLSHESIPEEGHYFWAYRIQITNEGDDVAQLLNRHWIITDAKGRKEEVKGAGVIGEQPALHTNEPFTYTSGCPLKTSSGFMVGSYEMKWLDGDKAGESFWIDVPTFSLDSPTASRSVN